MKSGRQFQTWGQQLKKGETDINVEPEMWYYKKLMVGRMQMLPSVGTSDRDAVVLTGVLWCMAVQTPMNCVCQNT